MFSSECVVVTKTTAWSLLRDDCLTQQLSVGQITAVHSDFWHNYSANSNIFLALKITENVFTHCGCTSCKKLFKVDTFFLFL